MVPYFSENGIELYHADCRDILGEIGYVDMVLTDPPYGINFQSNMRVATKKFAVLKNDDTDFRLRTYPMLYAVLKADAVMVAFCSFKNYAVDYTEIEKYFDIKNTIVWNKGGGGIGDLTCSLSTDYELAIVAHKGACKIRGKRDGSVWNVPKVNPAVISHPTEKPVALLARFIDTFTDRDAVVLDPYAGCGSTLVAAKQLNRRAIGIEIDEQYCHAAAVRLAQGELFV